MPAQLLLNVEAVLPEEIAQIPSAVEQAQGKKAKEEVAVQLHWRFCEALRTSAKSQLKALLQCATECIGLLPASKLVKDRVFELAMDPDGCRLVQAALQTSSRKGQSDIAAELKGHVCEMVGSPHANHVLQKLIELLPPGQVTFVLEEMASQWSPDYVAKHKFGCRVFERILEHFPVSNETCRPLADFLDQLLENAQAHCFHAMATFIMQHLLEHGSDKHKAAIVAAVHSNLDKVAMDSHASGVLDKALTLLPPEEQLSLAEQVLMVPGLLSKMAQSNRPAAARLLILVQGWHLAEAHRQLCEEFPESAQRVRLLRSLFGSKSPPPALSDLFEQEVSAELQAPVPETMGFYYEPACMMIPQQEMMVAGAWGAESSQDQTLWMTQSMYMWTG